MLDFKEVIASLGQMPMGKGQSKKALRNTQHWACSHPANGQASMEAQGGKAEAG